MYVADKKWNCLRVYPCYSDYLSQQIPIVLFKITKRYNETRLAEGISI